MRKAILTTAVVAALLVGLTYVSWRSPSDAPTLLPAEPPVVVQPKPQPKPKVEKPKPPSHTAFINIPALDIKQDVTMVLDDGPAFWNRTGRPGDGDTIAIAGHRTTHTAPFYSIDKLEPGNRIYVRYQGKVYTYEVRKSQVHPSSNLHIADAVGYERLLLTACATADGSPTSLDYRIVVYAAPV